MENGNIIEVDAGFGRMGFVVVGISNCSICQSESSCIFFSLQHETEEYVYEGSTRLCKKCIGVAFDNHDKWAKE